MKYSAIIFDMDGTIVDTGHVWKKANRVLIEKKGVEYTDELHQELSSRLGSLAMHQSCAIIKEVAGLEDPLEHLIHEKRSIASALYRSGIHFVDGFTDFHAAVASLVPTAVATNADEHIISATNDVLQLEKYFGRHIYGVHTVGNIGKPNPHIYLHTALNIDVAPELCIAIEDSAHGIAAAKAAGMFCVGINTANNRAALQQADVVIDTYSELDISALIDAKNT